MTGWYHYSFEYRFISVDFTEISLTQTRNAFLCLFLLTPLVVITFRIPYMMQLLSCVLIQIENCTRVGSTSSIIRSNSQTYKRDHTEPQQISLPKTTNDRIKAAKTLIPLDRSRYTRSIFTHQDGLPFTCS